MATDDPFKAALSITIADDRETFERQWYALGRAMWRTLEIVRESRPTEGAVITATIEVEDSKEHVLEEDKVVVIPLEPTPAMIQAMEDGFFEEHSVRLRPEDPMWVAWTRVYKAIVEAARGNV